MDLAGQECACGQHHRRRVETQAGLGDGAPHDVVLDHQVIDRGLEDRQVGLCFDHAPNGAAIQRTIGLAARRAHSRSLGGIERAPLDAGQVGGVRHGATERVDFLDQVALADAADGRVAAHCAHGFHVMGQQQGARTGAGGCQRGFGAGVAAADDDDFVVMEGSVHGPSLALRRATA
jgi:hypothetical protein